MELSSFASSQQPLPPNFGSKQLWQVIKFYLFRFRVHTSSVKQKFNRLMFAGPATLNTGEVEPIPNPCQLEMVAIQLQSDLSHYESVIFCQLTLRLCLTNLSQQKIVGFGIPKINFIFLEALPSP